MAENFKMNRENPAASKWNGLFSEGKIHERPSREIINLVPRLKAEGVVEILDAGCGTGRHANYLAQQGFNVHGIDISEEAIRLAESEKEGAQVDYRLAAIAGLPFPPNSMDFILASHSLEYTGDDLGKSLVKLDEILKKDKLIFVRVVSTQHVFYQAEPKDVYGFSHVGFCIQNGLPVHFFAENELRDLFRGYKIERLEQVSSNKSEHKRITVPLSEWVMLGRKN